jgi:hypothetical protein
MAFLWEGSTRRESHLDFFAIPRQRSWPQDGEKSVDPTAYSSNLVVVLTGVGNAPENVRLRPVEKTWGSWASNVMRFLLKEITLQPSQGSPA